MGADDDKKVDDKNAEPTSEEIKKQLEQGKGFFVLVFLALIAWGGWQACKPSAKDRADFDTEVRRQRVIRETREAAVDACVRSGHTRAWCEDPAVLGR